MKWAFITAIIKLGYEIWQEIENGNEHGAKRKLREAGDREINIAIAKALLKKRQKAKGPERADD